MLCVIHTHNFSFKIKTYFLFFLSFFSLQFLLKLYRSMIFLLETTSRSDKAIKLYCIAKLWEVSHLRNLYGSKMILNCLMVSIFLKCNKKYKIIQFILYWKVQEMQCVRKAIKPKAVLGVTFLIDRMYSRSKDRSKWNMDYCLLQFDALNFFLGPSYMGSLYLTLNFSI